MKTKNLLKVLSLAVLLGGVTKANFNNEYFSSKEFFLETTQGNDMFDDCQEGVKLIGPRRAQESGDLLASDVKVQISDVQENGTRSIRYVAAISSLAVDASFQRTIYNEDGSVFQEASLLAVNYAYESLFADGQEVFPSSFGEEYKYFIVYTLGNVPESHWYHRIDVSVNVNEEVSDRQANVEGVVKGYVQDSNLVYTERSSYPGQYQVAAASTDITSANISDYYVTYNDIVATRGKVSAIAQKGFQNCNNLELLSIPSTISYFEEMCFDGVDYIEEVRYNSKSSSKHSGVVMPDVGTLRIGSNVEKFPDGLFLSNSVGNLEYEGSKAEWDSINKGDTNFSLDEVKCEDSEIYTITFHFEGATLTVGGQEYTDTYSYDTYEGKTLVDPGKPEKGSETFDGWYLDEDFETKFSTVPATSNLDVYANFASFELGMDAEHPLPLNFGSNEMRTVTTAMPYTYYSFTPERTDYYSFNDVDTTTTKSTGIWIYAPGETSALASSTSGKFKVRAFLTEGVTYLVKAGSYQTTPSQYDYNYQVQISTTEGDQISEAVKINYNESVPTQFISLNDFLYFEYTVEEGKDFVRIDRFNSATVNIELYDKDTEELLETYTVNSTNTSKDFSLEVGKTYVFGVSSKAGLYNFALNEPPYGISLDRGIKYELSDGTVSMPVTTTNARKSETISSRKYYYYEIYYSFTPTETRTYSVTLTSSNNKGFVVDIYCDGSVIQSKGAINSTTTKAFTSNELEAGKEYVFHIKCNLNTSSTTKPTATLLIK